MKEKKKQILEEACNLFERFGYRKTTMDDLADATGIVKSSLYHYFPNKEELFRETTRYVYLDQKEKVESILARNDHIVDVFDALLNNIEEHITRMMPALKALIGDFDKIHTLIDDVFDTYYNTLIGLIEKRMDKAVQDGQLKKPVDTKIIVQVFITFFSVVFKGKQFSKIYQEISKDRRRYLEVMFAPYLVD